MAIHLFTYGTLTFPEVMQAVTNRVFKATDALLPGYERFCLMDKHYPGLIKTGQRATLGRVYLDIDPISLHRFDYFEDDLYLRQAVTVILPNDATLRADTYVVPPRHIHQISNHCWSKAYFRTFHLPEFLVQVHEWMSHYPT